MRDFLSFRCFYKIGRGGGHLLAEFRRFSDVNLDALLDVYSQSLDQKNWLEVNAFLEDLQLFYNNKNVCFSAKTEDLWNRILKRGRNVPF